MNSSLEKRLTLLKARVGGEPVTLTMPDGSVRQIDGRVKHWQALTAALFARDEADGLQASPLSIELSWLEAAEQIDGENSQAFALTRALCSSNDTGQEEDANAEGTLLGN